MAKFNNFGGGLNMNLIKQAQQMQQQMVQAQEELASMEFTGVSGGGLVSVVMNGKKSITAVNIKKEAVDVDDIEMLEDLIIAAINDASNKQEKENSSKMGAFAGLGL